jgi:hypothetical protein
VTAERGHSRCSVQSLFRRRFIYARVGRHDILYGTCIDRMEMYVVPSLGSISRPSSHDCV